MLAITGAGLHLYTLLAANKGEGKPEPPAQATTKPSPPPEPTPAPPPKPTVVVAFDFDKCLMTSHWSVLPRCLIHHSLESPRPTPPLPESDSQQTRMLSVSL